MRAITPPLHNLPFKDFYGLVFFIAIDYSGGYDMESPVQRLFLGIYRGHQQFSKPLSVQLNVGDVAVMTGWGSWEYQQTRKTTLIP